MANRHLRGLSNEDIYTHWQNRFERIHEELTFLFAVRRRFRQVQEMFRSNEDLRTRGEPAWEWLLLLWGRDAVMAVRRELDDDTNTISLGTLLDEMASRPDVLDRRRYMAHMTGCDRILVRANEEAFTGWGVLRPSTDSMDDYLDPARIRADRDGLDAASGPVLEYANRLVAHRTPVGPLLLTDDDIHVAIDAMEPVVQKYHVILTGSALVAVEPVEMEPLFLRAFEIPWRVRTR